MKMKLHYDWYYYDDDHHHQYASYSSGIKTETRASFELKKNFIAGKLIFN